MARRSNVNIKLGTTRDVVDGKMTIYSYVDKAEAKKGVVLYSYSFYPLFPESEKIKLRSLYPTSTIVNSLILTLEHLYESQQRHDCLRIFFERSSAVGSENKKYFLENEISIVEQRKVNNYTYPIFERLTTKTLENKRLFNHIQRLMIYQEENSVEDINDLLWLKYDLNKWGKLKPTPHFAPILNCISNIIYFKFLGFLKGQLELPPTTQAPEIAKIDDKFYIQSEEKIAKLYQSLISYDPPLIKVNPSFVESFRTKEVDPSKRTKWLGEQTEAFYLIFLLIGKREHHIDKEPIPNLAFRLFTFPKLKKPSLHTCYVNYQKFIPKIKEASYLKSKQKRITKIYASI